MNTIDRRPSEKDTYIEGPRSEENSQWKMIAWRLPGESAAASATGWLGSQFASLFSSFSPSWMTLKRLLLLFRLKLLFLSSGRRMEFDEDCLKLPRIALSISALSVISVGLSVPKKYLLISSLWYRFLLPSMWPAWYSYG